MADANQVRSLLEGQEGTGEGGCGWALRIALALASRRVSPLFLMLTFSGLSLLSLAVRLRLPAGLEEDDGQARSLRGPQLGLSLWGQRVRSCVCYA